MSELNDVLEKVGFTENELKVYQVAVAFGFRTKGQIVSYTTLSYDEVDAACTLLVEKNYFKKIVNLSEEAAVYLPLAPKIAISGEVSQNLSKRLTQLSSNVSNLWDKTQQIIDDDTSKLVEVAETSLDDLRDFFERNSEEYKKSIDTLSNKFKTKVTEKTESASVSFQERINQPLSDLSTKLNSLATTIEKLCDESISSIENSSEDHKASLEESSTVIKTEMNEFLDSVGLFTVGRISGVSQQIEDSSLSATEKSESTVGGFHSSIDDLITSDTKIVADIDAKLPGNLLDKFNSLMGTQSTSFETFSTNFSLLVDKTGETSTTAINAVVHGAQEVIKSIDQSQKTKLTTVEKNLLGAIKTVQSKAVSQLSEVLRGTGKELGDLQKGLVQKLKQNEKKLNSDLTTLESNLSSTMNERFEDVKTRLGEFIQDLQNTSRDNVSEIVTAVSELKNYLLDFLQGTQQSLSEEYNNLKSSVKKNISGIVVKTNSSIDKINTNNTESINTLNAGISESLSSFQSSINDFLNNVKEELQQDLTEAQSNFMQGVKDGVQAYQEESEQRQKEQNIQLREMESESDALTELGRKAKDDLVLVAESELKEKKTSVIGELKETVTTSSEKFTREFSRFNERLERTMKEFYEDFHESSSGLRDDVPQEIEKLFIDQSDRFEDFRRDFNRNMGHANDLLKDMNEMFKNKKKLGKSEIQELDEKLTRTIADFEYFEQSIGNHFTTVIDDTEGVKNELLNSINKTIQDELSSLESLVNSKSKQSSDLADEFLSGLGNHTKELIDGFENGISESVTTLESTITTELIGKFEQPLDSILSKAKYIATGTEGADQENRLIRTQEKLVGNLQSEIDKLVMSLQNAFTNSISTVDDQVSKSILDADKIVTDLRTNLDKTFDAQKSSVSRISDEFKESLADVKKSINSTLDKALTESISNVIETVQAKSAEVDESVTSKTTNIQSATTKSIEEMDSTLSTFSEQFDSILSSTNKDVKSMVDTTTSTQKVNLTGTVKQLSETVDKAQGTLQSTHKSLTENVGKELSAVETTAKTLVKDFNTTLTITEKELLKDVTKHFAPSKKHIKDLEKLKVSLGTSLTKVTKEMDSAGKQIQKNLNAELAKHQKSRKANITGFKTKVTGTIKEISEINSDLLVEMFDLVNTQLSVLQGEVNEYVANAKVTVDDTVTNSIENVRMDIVSASSSVSNALVAEKDESPVKIREVVQLVESLDGVQENEFTSAKTELIKSIVDTVDNNMEVWTGSGDQVFKTQISNIEKIGVEFKEKIESNSSSGKKVVSNALNTIPSTIEETLDAAAKSMTLLNEISKGSVTLDPKFPELSYFDSSSEAILANLNGVLSRTKSSVTIVSPSISWLDESIIPGFARVSVKIITDVDNASPASTKIIEKIRASGVNLDLRKIDRNRFRGEIDMIMASRDKEEVILAKLPESKDPYAFVSQDEDFVNKFTELFAPFQTMPRVT